MTDQDMEVLEVLFQRYTELFKREINVKINQILEIIEATSHDLDKNYTKFKGNF